jgi:hypothetical protein
VIGRAAPCSIAPVWTDDDEACLVELEAGVLVRSLFAHHVGRRDATISRRAAVLIDELARQPVAAAPLAAARAGDFAPLVAHLEARPADGVTPRYLHAVAIYLDRVAHALSSIPGAAARVDALRVRAMEAFARIGEERDYLSRRAKEIDPTSTATEAGLVADLASTSLVEDVGAEAHRGAGTLTADSARALGWLAGLAVALPPGARHARRAESLRAQAIEAALAPLLDRARVARAADKGLVQTFADVRAAWEWSGRDEAVERFAVDEITDVAWVVYRKSDWVALRGLLEPCWPAFENLAARIEQNPVRELAYTAKCAQIFVFASEAATDRDRSFALAERALRLCPTHRNARVILAHALCERAIALANRGLLARRPDLDEAKANLERAEKLFPQLKRLPEARSLIGEMERRMTR